jgi:DNA primase
MLLKTQAISQYMDYDYKQIIEKIRREANLAAIISQKLPLEKRGNDFWGLCPFHQEKTPSFKVDTKTNSWYCFGCQAKGSVFDFIMQTKGVDFGEAVQLLAREMGLEISDGPLTPAQKQRREARRRLLHLLELTSKFYQAQLDSPAAAPAKKHLLQRGVNRELAAEFALGYAPDSWNALRHHLNKHGVDESLALAAGVLAVKDGGRKEAYDRFRNRIIIPICDSDGKIISLGGRALGHDPAKYLNGAKSLIFKKGEHLFNLHRARRHVKERGRIILVEGYFDAITLAAHGMGEVVASMGTALTAEQVNLLSRQSQEIILLFDGDAAGRKAATKALGLFLQAELSPKVLWLPKGEDPDSLVRTQGAETLRSGLSQARPLIQAVLEDTIKQGPIDTPEGKSALVKKCGEIIKAIKDPVLQSGYAEYAAAELNLHPALLLKTLGLPAAPGRQYQARPLKPAAQMLTNPLLFLETALSGPEAARRIVRAGILDTIESEKLQPIARALSELVNNGELPSVDNLKLRLNNQPSLCQQIDHMFRRAPKEDLPALEEQITFWRNKDLEKQMSAFRSALAQALSAQDYQQAKLVREQMNSLRARLQTKDPRA